MNQFIENGKIVIHPVVDMNATGSNIKTLREKAGFSVKDLAELLEFEAVQGIYHWQKGKTLPTIENLILLSELFNKSINEIVICAK